MKKFVNVITVLAVIAILFSCKKEISPEDTSNIVKDEISVSNKNTSTVEVKSDVDSSNKQLSLSDFNLDSLDIYSSISAISLNELIYIRRDIQSPKYKKIITAEIEKRIFQTEDFFETVEIRNLLFYGAPQGYSLVAKVYEQDIDIYQVINDRLHEISSNMSKEALLEALMANNEPEGMWSENLIDKLILNQLTKKMETGDKVDTLMQLVDFKLYQENITHKGSNGTLVIDYNKKTDVIYGKAKSIIYSLSFNQMLEFKSKIQNLLQSKKSDMISHLDNYITRENEPYVKNNFRDSINNANLEKLYDYKEMILNFNDEVFKKAVQIQINYRILTCNIGDMPIILKNYEAETAKTKEVIKEYFRKIILENDSELREIMEEIKRNQIPEDLKLYVELLMAIKFT